MKYNTYNGYMYVFNFIMFVFSALIELEALINKIRNNVLAGLDDIKPTPMSNVCSIISHPIADIISKTL